LREATLFGYRAGEYKSALKAFYIYRDRYGFNRELYMITADILIATRRFRDALNILKDVEGRERSYNFKLYKEIVDLANYQKAIDIYIAFSGSWREEES